MYVIKRWKHLHSYYKISFIFNMLYNFIIYNASILFYLLIILKSHKDVITIFIIYITEWYKRNFVYFFLTFLYFLFIICQFQINITNTLFQATYRLNPNIMFWWVTMMITEKKFLTISVHPEFISRNRYYCSCNVMAIEWWKYY